VLAYNLGMQVARHIRFLAVDPVQTIPTMLTLTKPSTRQLALAVAWCSLPVKLGNSAHTGLVTDHP
jgi:hypothetical protein